MVSGDDHDVQQSEIMVAIRAIAFAVLDSMIGSEHRSSLPCKRSSTPDWPSKYSSHVMTRTTYSKDVWVKANAIADRNASSSTLLRGEKTPGAWSFELTKRVERSEETVSLIVSDSSFCANPK